ncbi:MAG: hypothetical protein ACI93T_004463 [Porticoccaceae bacterium]|jgi:hypothetical protein
MTDQKSPRESECDLDLSEPVAGRTAAKMGVGLILLSGVLWFSLFVIPFLPLTIGQKAALAGADFVGVQIAWWVGVALAGPELVAKLKSWFKRRKTTDES